MTQESLRDLLQAFQRGEIALEALTTRLSQAPVGALGFARVDHHRALRCGFPEVIFAAAKSTEQVLAIAQEILSRSERLLATRVTPECAEALIERFPGARFHPTARVVTVDRLPQAKQGLVAVVCAGTGDLPVAEEARVTAEALGARTLTVYDAGVAGIHRLLDESGDLRRAHAIVVVAGMEGALASVVGGLVACPVFATPTSVGYGASFGGLAALLAMLNSCAAGVSVVNIDNGFGAGYCAALVNRAVASGRLEAGG